MRSHDIPWEKGKEGLSMETFWSSEHFIPESRMLTQWQRAIWTSVTWTELTFPIHIRFSQANKMFPCVWITKEYAQLSVNTAIWAFVDVLRFVAEPEFLVYSFYTWALWPAILHLGPHLGQHFLKLNVRTDQLRILWKYRLWFGRHVAAPGILHF